MAVVSQYKASRSKKRIHRNVDHVIMRMPVEQCFDVWSFLAHKQVWDVDQTIIAAAIGAARGAAASGASAGTAAAGGASGATTMTSSVQQCR